MMKYSVIFLLMFISNGLISQTKSPRIVAYAGVLHPVVTFNKDGSTFNLEHAYQVGFPTGINVWQTAKTGYSMELVPLIRADRNGSAVNNLLFHPGVLFALGHGYVLAGRAAFETSGRYGVTPILNKVVVKSKSTSYYVALPVPVRFGGQRPSSVTIAFQFGVVF